MTARAHIDLSQNITNLLELPLNDFLKGQEHVKHYVSDERQRWYAVPGVHHYFFPKR